MPFALIPDGFKLQKVTKAQQQAVDKYYSNKATEAFLEGDASAELAKTAAIVVTPIVLAVLANQALERAKELNINIPSADFEELKALALRVNPITLPADITLNVLRRGGLLSETEEARLRELLPIL